MWSISNFIPHLWFTNITWIFIYKCAYAGDLIIASVVKHLLKRNPTLLIATNLPALAAMLTRGVSPFVMSVKSDGHLSQLATANCGFWTPWNVSFVSESLHKVHIVHWRDDMRTSLLVMFPFVDWNPKTLRIALLKLSELTVAVGDLLRCPPLLSHSELESHSFSVQLWARHVIKAVAFHMQVK